MIISQEKEALILEEGASSETIGMSLDSESTHMLMQMLSKNLYSDPIGSTVRELASNALDSHRRAGVEGTPIIVRLKANEQGNYEFSVEDFGVGLNDVDVRDIISKYGKSTKRNSNVELGAFGLGIKSPLSYSSTFYFICRKDGMERKYMMYEGEDNNSIDLLHEHPTEQGNGVKMIVPLKSNYDRFEFIRKIREQLAYFENVFFDVEGISNTFRIFRNEHYQWSELASDTKVHICLDNVYYPIDFSKLSIRPIEIPIGLRFSLSDGIVPTPNRESIRYTHNVIERILNKIKELCTHFFTEFNNSLTETEDVMGVLNFYANEKKVKLPNGKEYNISPLEPYSSVKMAVPSIKGLPYITKNFATIFKSRDDLFTDYRVNYSYRNRKFIKENNHRLSYWNLHNDRVRVVVIPRELDIMTKRYLKEQWGDRGALVVEKYREIPLNSGSVNSYYSILRLKDVPRNEWRTFIEEYQKMKQMIVSSRFEDMSTLSVPQDWVKNYKESLKRPSVKGVKRQKRESVLEGEMKFRLALGYNGYNSDFRFTNDSEDMKKAHKRNGLTVYGKEEDRKSLTNLYNLFSNTVRFCIVSEKNFETLEKADIHNWKSVTKFTSKDSRHMRKLATVNAIVKLLLYDIRRSEIIAKLSTPLSQSLIKLSEYVKKTKIKQNTELMEELAKGIPMNLSVQGEYMFVQRFVEKHPCIKVMNDVPPYAPVNLQDLLRDGLKYNKCRLNYEHYVKRGGQ